MEEHEDLPRESISTVETDNPACKLYKNAEEESENADKSSYLTAGRFKDTAPEHEEVTCRQLDTTFEEPSTEANDSSRNCMNAEDGVDAENETSENNAVAAAYSYLSEAHQQCINTQQGGSLLITGRLKVMGFVEELTGQQLDNNTFKE